MFGLARSPDLVKWSLNSLIITPDSIKIPVINAKINIIVLSILSSSGIDIGKFIYLYSHSAMTSLLLYNNVPFHLVKMNVRCKSNDIVYTFYDKRIIGKKSGGFLNTVAQIS
ncbi:hypothetical protein ACTFIR_003935 [Dictyostelium discoideum]